jgi:hypothetical protein
MEKDITADDEGPSGDSERSAVENEFLHEICLSRTTQTWNHETKGIHKMENIVWESDDIAAEATATFHGMISAETPGG